MAAMKETSRKVYDYLKDTEGTDVTLNSISDALDMPVRSVNGCLVGMQKKGLVVREEVVSADDAGKAVTTKFIRLTEAAADFNPDAE